MIIVINTVFQSDTIQNPFHHLPAAPCEALVAYAKASATEREARRLPAFYIRKNNVHIIVYIS
jgi:hypothetical protein